MNPRILDAGLKWQQWKPGPAAVEEWQCERLLLSSHFPSLMSCLRGRLLIFSSTQCNYCFWKNYKTNWNECLKLSSHYIVSHFTFCQVFQLIETSPNIWRYIVTRGGFGPVSIHLSNPYDNLLFLPTLMDTHSGRFHHGTLGTFHRYHAAVDIWGLWGLWWN